MNHSHCWKYMYNTYLWICAHLITVPLCSFLELNLLIYMYHCVLGQHMPCSLLQGYQRTLMFRSSLKWLRCVISLLILRGIRFITSILQVMIKVILHVNITVMYKNSVFKNYRYMKVPLSELMARAGKTMLLWIWCITVLNGAFYP